MIFVHDFNIALQDIEIQYQDIENTKVISISCKSLI